MNCEDVVTYLSDYLDGTLEEDLVLAAREHIATCNNCRVVLDSTQKTILMYREQGQATRIPLERHQSLYETIAAAFKDRK